MNRKIQNIFLLLFLCLVSLTAKAQKNSFTAAEQQQISIATPGLFERSNVFNIDLKILSAKEYSFPLPVGKATLKNNLSLEITSVKGDIVFGNVRWNCSSCAQNASVWQRSCYSS